MELKKFGHNLDLKGIVIHQLNKNAGDRKVVLKSAKQLITVKDKEKIFIGRLNDSYHKKSNPTYGIFAGTQPAFKETLDTYLINNDLFSFSVAAATLYKATLENTISATGGFLIFTDFVNTDNKNRYMLLLTINNKDGYVVSEKDLTLEDIKNLDLSKVDVACMINLTKWKNVEAGADMEAKTYLSFVRGNKGVSYYFMSFIDCDNKTSNTESSRRLTKSLDAYATEKNYDRVGRITLKNKVYDYCIDCMKNKKEIQLSAISAVINPEDIEAFLQFASSDEYGVSETIKGDKTQLKRIKYIMYHDTKYTVEFDLDLLGKEVVYNVKRQELTFKKLPEALISQIPT